MTNPPISDQREPSQRGPIASIHPAAQEGVFSETQGLTGSRTRGEIQQYRPLLLRRFSVLIETGSDLRQGRCVLGHPGIKREVGRRTPASTFSSRPTNSCWPNPSWTPLISS